jgi:fatty-acyl-CoA synthase
MRPGRVLIDTEQSEQIPLAARLAACSTYELLRAAAETAPEQLALCCVPPARPFHQPVSLTYRVLLGKLHQSANLLADLGIGTQDVIALLLPDLLETHLLLWGGQAAGIVCPIHPAAPLDQVTALVHMVGTKVLVAPGPEVSQDLWRKAELLRREMESIKVVLQVQGAGNERDAIYAFGALLADYPASRLLTGREIAPDDIAIYFPTTDTTGVPGFVPLTHGALLYAAWAFGLVTMLAPEQVLLRGLLRFFQGWWWPACKSWH